MGKEMPRICPISCAHAGEWGESERREEAGVFGDSVGFE